MKPARIVPALVLLAAAAVAAAQTTITTYGYVRKTGFALVSVHRIRVVDERTGWSVLLMPNWNQKWGNIELRPDNPYRVEVIVQTGAVRGTSRFRTPRRRAASAFNAGTTTFR